MWHCGRNIPGVTIALLRLEEESKMAADVKHEADKKKDKEGAQLERIEDKLEDFVLARQQEFWPDTPTYGLGIDYKNKVYDMIAKIIRKRQR